MSKQEANPNFYCPITQELMRDPVVDRDGNSYEREAITNWLQRNSFSPITRNPMAQTDLVPNRSLRSSIEDYLNKAVLTSEAHSAESKCGDAKEDGGDIAAFDAPTVALVRCSSSASESAQTYLVTVKSEEPCSLRRHPATIVCVVDTSGSMCSEAAVQGVESTGLSMLDIVKHAVRTVLTTLGDHDRFGLVTFSTQGKVSFQLMYMNAAGKALALSKVADLFTGGSTNLWDGLRLGMDMLAAAGDTAGNSALFLLTDGVPSEIPPRGHIPMMQRYRDTNGGRYPGTINTFGFGYSLDSDLLSQMAIEGGGMYSFIPDSGFVGTAFVNALGNHLSSYGKQCIISVEMDSGSRVPAEGAVLGMPEHTVSSWGVALKVPNLLSGTSQDFIFTTCQDHPGTDPSVRVSLTYEHFVRSSADCKILNVERRTIEMPSLDHIVADNSSVSTEDTFRSLWLESHRLRLSVVDALRIICEEMKTAETTPLPQHTTRIMGLIGDCDRLLERIGNLARSMSSAYAGQVKDVSARVSGLKDDLKGQVTEAISKSAWYNKWGKHYLLSLQRAHLLMQCNNFKDPGIQHYGGALFRHYRDKADDVFMSLPPPTPSRSVYGSYQAVHAAASTPAPSVNMAAYNDVSGGCVHEDAIVHMADGSFRPIRALKKGDLVYSGNNVSAEVVCMVRTKCDKGIANLVSLDSGLRITAWHPVKDDHGNWCFPASLCATGALEQMDCQYVYTFVLCEPKSEGLSKEISYVSSMVVDSMECIALGHGIENDDVASHDFFGTYRVIDNLKRISGWENGLVSLVQSDFLRNNMSGQIEGLACNI